MSIQIIGIDCATVNSKVGLAFGRFADGRAILTEAYLCPKDKTVSETIVAALQPPTLLALDAPLGWPAPLGQALVDHTAGKPIPAFPDELFNRETDRFIQQTVGKRPLEVGADRIARTALAALRLLGEISRAVDQPIPLAWQAAFPGSLAAIEIYPAATLKAYGLPTRDYKKPAQKEARAAMTAQLAGLITLPADHTPLIASADVLDAAVCLLAATDFLAGNAIPPSNEFMARREGWIWIRQM